MLLPSSADFFPKLNFSKNSFRNTIRLSKDLDSDQDQHNVGPDLGPKCLQGLSADNKSPSYCKEKVKRHTFRKETLLHMLHIFEK